MESNLYITTGQLIRNLRLERNLPLRKIAALLDMDTSFLSKIERNSRKPTREHIIRLAEIFEVDKDYLMVPYLSELIYYEISNEECASLALEIAQERIKTKKEDIV